VAYFSDLIATTTPSGSGENRAAGLLVRPFGGALTAIKDAITEIGDGIRSIVDGDTKVSVSEQGASSSSFYDVISSVSSVVLVSGSLERKMVVVYNDTSDNDLHLKLGLLATTASFSVKIPSQGYYELPQPVYTGDITGAWLTGSSGYAKVTELFE